MIANLASKSVRIGDTLFSIVVGCTCSYRTDIWSRFAVSFVFHIKEVACSALIFFVRCCWCIIPRRAFSVYQSSKTFGNLVGVSTIVGWS
jgi:hypothetical protein